MDIVHAGRMPWGENLVAHRHADIAHKVLFEGLEGAADNYVFVLARESKDYYSPRHRHAWDQVRYCLEGSIPIGRDLSVDTGEVGYFPEGVPYGPQEGGTDRIVLLLQFGGASGLGFLSVRQLREAREALLAQGAFEGGVFRRTSGDGPKNQDAYEALWRHVTGQPIRYPKPRFKTPLVMRPDGFDWREVEGASGVRQRALGRFTDRGLMLDVYGLESGATIDLGAADALRLVFVKAGDVQSGGVACEPFTAIRTVQGEAARFTATSAAELFVITASTLSPRASESVHA